MTKTGIELIADERQRQIEIEGWSLEHDDGHEDESLAMAATCYASPEPVFAKLEAVRGGDCFYDPFPWGHTVRGRSVDDADDFYQYTTEEVKKDKNRKRQLVIAGALIAAEIDRLQRAEARHPDSAQVE